MTKGSYRITPKAAQDLRNIGRYTQKKWGKRQRDTYLLAFEKRFAWLAAQPDRGKTRADVKEGYYSYLQGSHVIFYLIGNEGIDIIGIPHQRMDIMNYFT